jgi:hypothetical protein
MVSDPITKGISFRSPKFHTRYFAVLTSPVELLNCLEKLRMFMKGGDGNFSLSASIIPLTFS